MSICVVLSEVIGTLKEASILSLTPPKHTDRIKSQESEDRVHQTRKYHPNDPGKSIDSPETIYRSPSAFIGGKFQTQ